MHCQCSTLSTSLTLLSEHVTAVTVSIKDKLTLSLGVAVGSSIVSDDLSAVAVQVWNIDAPLDAQQIALFVIPFTIVLAWIIGKPLTLLFDPFESIVLFLSGMGRNDTIELNSNAY